MMIQNAPRPSQLPEADRAIQAWTRAALRRLVWGRLAAAVVCFLASAATLWLTWWAWRQLFFLGEIQRHDRPPDLKQVDLLTWIAFGVTVVTYFVIDRTWLESESEILTECRMERPFGGLGRFDADGNSRLGTMGWLAMLQLLWIGPALAHRAFCFLWDSLTAWRADALLVGSVLCLMSREENRVPLSHLKSLIGDTAAGPWLEPLLLIDGIIFRQSDPPGFVLTDALRKRLPRRKKAGT